MTKSSSSVIVFVGVTIVAINDWLLFVWPSPNRRKTPQSMYINKKCIEQLKSTSERDLTLCMTILVTCEMMQPKRSCLIHFYIFLFLALLCVCVCVCKCWNHWTVVSSHILVLLSSTILTVHTHIVQKSISSAWKIQQKDCVNIYYEQQKNRIKREWDRRK